jgi:putative membrane protein
MIKNRTFAWLAAASLALVPFISKADTNNAQAQLSRPDMKVLQDLHNSNQKEIQIGNLALNKTQSADIKQYANQLVSDHTDADKKVKDLADKHNAALKDPKMNMAYDMLNTKSGADFDNAFVKNMVDDHRKDIKSIQAAQKNLQSQDVKELVSAILPTLQEHERHAAQLVGNTPS